MKIWGLEIWLIFHPLNFTALRGQRHNQQCSDVISRCSSAKNRQPGGWHHHWNQPMDDRAHGRDSRERGSQAEQGKSHRDQ